MPLASEIYNIKNSIYYLKLVKKRSLQISKYNKIVTIKLSKTKPVITTKTTVTTKGYLFLLKIA